jgi:hypothetical protein
MRSISALAADEGVTPERRPRTFIGISVRTDAKPECISALTERAMARAVGSCGQPLAFGKRSATYSQIASESQIVVAPSINAGTRPEGERSRISRGDSGW